MKKFINILGIILVILIIISFSHYIRTGDLLSISFSSFLDNISNLPKIEFNRNLFDFTIYGDWGIFDFYRIFVNRFSDIFELLFAFGAFIGQVFNYLFNFFKLFFI